MAGEEIKNNPEEITITDTVDNKGEEQKPADSSVNEETASPEQEGSEEQKEVEKPEEKQEPLEKPSEEKPEVNLEGVKEPEQAKEILQDKGFDYVKLQEEYNQTGTISQETREELVKSGITDEIIDNYIEGQKAKVEKEIEEISSDIGGKDGFSTVIDWAGKNLDQAEIQSINAVRDKNIMKIILKDLKKRMDEKEGITPEYTKGDGGTASVALFQSQAQMMEAIRDPRHAKDPAYRAEVAKKVAASREAGIDLGI